MWTPLKNIIQVQIFLFNLSLALVLCATLSMAESWKSFVIGDLGISLELPDLWYFHSGKLNKTLLYAEANSPKRDCELFVTFVAASQKDMNLILKEELQKWSITQLEEPETETINGLDVILAEGRGWIGKNEAGFFLSVFKLKAGYAVVYLVSDLWNFEQNSVLMNEILDRIRPIPS